jgi:hypothetical protein
MPTLLLFVFKIQNLSWGITFLFVFDQIIPITIKCIYQWIYCNVKICKIRMYWMSSIVLPTIAALPIFFFSWFWLNYVFYALWAAVGVIVAAAISIVVAFILLFFFMYFPILSLIGGFDDYMFFIFKKAVEISGPSKPMLKIMEKVMEQAIKASRKMHLYGRWGIPYAEAHKEIEELMLMKASGQLKMLQDT